MLMWLRVFIYVFMQNYNSISCIIILAEGKLLAKKRKTYWKSVNVLEKRKLIGKT